MSDLKLFRTVGDKVAELPGSGVTLERSLQTLIEKNMDTMFGVRFLASEYSTGVKHGGRIDSLGLDENGSPVIFEYKRATNENVINQGLFYYRSSSGTTRTRNADNMARITRFSDSTLAYLCDDAGREGYVYALLMVREASLHTTVYRTDDFFDDL